MDRKDANDDILRDLFNSAILMVGKQGDQYFIITGNHLKTERVMILKEKIDELNALSKDEIREKYREVLSNEGFSEKGGAGLGLIDIIRKSGENVDYAFRSIDKDYSFFSLKANIAASKKS